MIRAPEPDGSPRQQGMPPAGGNRARDIRDGVEGSLRRLRTDCVDMCWTHVCDRASPAEEILPALTGPVRRSDILYRGFSNPPS